MSITRKRLKMHKGRAGGDTKVFAMLPDEVLRSDAWKTAPHQVRALVTIVAAQYRGHNNGSLTVTRKMLVEDYDFSRNPYVQIESFAEAEERGLLIVTRHGTTNPPRSAMFALGWCKIDAADRNDPHEATPTLQAPNHWAKWVAKVRGWHWATTRHDRSKEKDRVTFKKPDLDGPVRCIPRDTRPGIPRDTRKAANGYPQGYRPRPEIQYPQGYISEISMGGTNDPQAVGVRKGDPALVDVAHPAGEKRARAPDARVGDLAGRWDELTGRARKKLVEHGYDDLQAAGFYRTMRRSHGEAVVLTATSDYLELRPRHVQTGEQLDPKEWIYWRVRELVGKPVPGVPRLVPDAPATDRRAPADGAGPQEREQRGPATP